jgi:glycerophosphoryl diester phosphodiesterase
VIRVGHRGAPLLAPENTVRSIERAIELGVDFVEVDVVPLADGTLVLAHSDDLLEVSHGAASGRVTNESLEELRRVAPELPTLDEALAVVAASGAGVQLDVKASGYEEELVEAVRRHGLVERALVSSFHVPVLQLLGDLEPGLRRGLTYPSDRRGVAGRPWVRPLVPAALRGLRAALPRRIARLLAAADASTAVLHFSVVSGAVVRRVHDTGGEVWAWTVDDADLCARLARLGVDGLITNDPGMFTRYL